MNKWLVVVAIAVYAGSMTGNSIWDLFGKKSLSPKRNSVSDKVSLDRLVVSHSVDSFL